jgi:vacuolar-type H+-ATPase subunit E/Vma4
MALEDLTKKILADAEAHLARTRAHATETVARMKAEASTAEVRERAEYAQETKRLCEKQTTLATQRAQQEARTLVENAKRALLNETFQNALASIVETADAEYVRYIEPLLKQLLDCKEEIHTVCVPPSRIAITKSVCERLGLTATVEPRGDIQAGFVAVGRLSEYDARLEQRMAQVQRKHESKIHLCKCSRTGSRFRAFVTVTSRAFGWCKRK